MKNQTIINNTAAMLMLAMGSTSACMAQAPSFTIVNDASCSFHGISPDGTVAVGVMLLGSRNPPCYWTRSQGLRELPLAAGMINGKCNDATRGGAIIVGNVRFQSASSNQPSAYWAGFSQPIVLGDLPGGTLTGTTTGVSADGRVMVGEGRSSLGPEAWIWTQQSGMVGLGDLPGGSFFSLAEGVSADGTVVTGYGRNDRGDEAFRWTPQTGMIGAGTPSRAWAVSSDGTTIVGGLVTSSSPSAREAFRWHVDTGVVSLGVLAGMTTATAYSVNSDGTVIGGECTVRMYDGTIVHQAFIWDPDHGMRLLEEVLRTDFMIFLGAFSPASIEAISDDGSVLAGYGFPFTGASTGTTGFVAVLPRPIRTLNALRISPDPAPTPCAADFDFSGGVDGGDVEAFFAAWESGDPLADVNQSGGIDGADVEEFFLIWQIGC